MVDTGRNLPPPMGMPRTPSTTMFWAAESLLRSTVPAGMVNSSERGTLRVSSTMMLSPEEEPLPRTWASTRPWARASRNSSTPSVVGVGVRMGARIATVVGVAVANCAVGVGVGPRQATSVHVSTNSITIRQCHRIRFSSIVSLFLIRLCSQSTSGRSQVLQGQGIRASGESRVPTFVPNHYGVCPVAAQGGLYLSGRAHG